MLALTTSLLSLILMVPPSFPPTYVPPGYIGHSPDPAMTWTTPNPTSTTVKSNTIFTEAITVTDFDTYYNGLNTAVFGNNSVWVAYTINSGTLFQLPPPSVPVPNPQLAHPSTGTNTATFTILAKVVQSRSYVTDIMYAIDNQTSQNLHDPNGSVVGVLVTIDPEK